MPCILTVNRGSSSLKFAVYQRRDDDGLDEQASGNISGLGMPEATLSIADRQRGASTQQSVGASGQAALDALVDWLERRIGLARVQGIGHRIVHGGAQFSQPRRITPELVRQLRSIEYYDPDHLPYEIALVELFASRCSQLPQVACFDTAFHRTMPREARMLPIPRRYFEQGVQRYGFHGLSYQYLIEELARIAPAKARGRVVLAHLGAGASLAAVLNGRSLDTSMGFTPAAGVPMATRSGDLDPGLVSLLARTEQMSAGQFDDMVNHRSGLLGLSGSTGDMKALLDQEGKDPRAADAVAVFCYQVRKCIGALAAALGGLDAIVFSGGIGERAWPIRQRICSSLPFLGVDLEACRNQAHATMISTDVSRTAVYVIPTNEQLVIARSTIRVLDGETADS